MNYLYVLGGDITEKYKLHSSPWKHKQKEKQREVLLKLASCIPTCQAPPLGHLGVTSLQSWIALVAVLSQCNVAVVVSPWDMFIYRRAGSSFPVTHFLERPLCVLLPCRSAQSSVASKLPSPNPQTQACISAFKQRYCVAGLARLPTKQIPPIPPRWKLGDGPSGSSRDTFTAHNRRNGWSTLV